MQTSISAEEFARFQNQLLDLRQAKYFAEENLTRAQKKTESLEAALAHQSGELAELRSRFSLIQHAGDIEALAKENHCLRQRLLNVESSFQLQSSTLRAECERLQAENNLLKQDSRVASSYSTSHLEVQTELISLISTASQTYTVGRASAEIQTEITSSNLKEWFTKAEELDNLSALLEAERKTSEDLLRDVARREIEIERLEGELEVLRGELTVAEKRSESVRRELQRQLASAVKAAKRASTCENAPSLSSLVMVPNGANLDGISVDSFSFCQMQTGNDSGGGEGSETSSSSQAHQQALQQTMFTEDDLKGLLARLSEVQEENCSLRHQLSKLTLELDAKSKIIQRSINAKFTPNSLPPQSHSSCRASCPESHSNARIQTSSTTTGSNPMRLASDMISTLRSKIKNMETFSSTSLNTDELKGLKRLCEELMTRNIYLERALEGAVAGARTEMED
ncbi:unnamed protein product [Rodentolepis nana]|uniref:GRIP1-associated protein 1 n=1 Tax=Rodentolepis nana TaxID=102285 RepID=A0A0R3TZS4_RODNA|nr:unnamed protein product [Rodentolepis nana]